jgi:hypothetical protein
MCEVSQSQNWRRALYWQLPLLVAATLFYFILTGGFGFLHGGGASSDYKAYAAMVEKGSRIPRFHRRGIAAC